MTTQSWTTVMDHSSDAGFRAWGLELNTKLAAAGLVQTADTGQVNWGTVTRPGTNTEGGYEIWRFNDAKQSTSPIFMRIGYGTGGSATLPRLSIILGTSTNGAGTIGGGALSGSLRTFSTGLGADSAEVAYASYLCVTEGFFGLAWKYGGSSGTRFLAGVAVARSVDTDGIPDDRGMVLYCGTNIKTAHNFQAFSFASGGVAYSNRVAPPDTRCIVPHHRSASAVGADLQAFLHWFPTPQIVPALSMCTVVASEVPIFNTFSATLVGAVAHTYISLGNAIWTAESTGSSDFGFAMFWE